MLRGAIVIIFLGFMTALILPFLLSSVYIDQRGIVIPGQVYHKREDVIVRRNVPRLQSEATIEYSKPDGSGDSFLKVPLTAASYDELHVGKSVRLHYLRPEDIPDVPFAKAFRRMQLLPTVRMADRRLFDDGDSSLSPHENTFLRIVGASILILVVWRLVRLPAFGWIVALLFATLVVSTTIFDFPRPLPPPSTGVRTGTGRIKSVEKITRLMSGRKRRGFDTSQPIDVVGVEFIPEGRTDPVVAMDLIDAGSLPGLREHASLTVDYESANPRTAYLHGATRNFASRNLEGIAFQCVAVVTVLGSFLFVYHLIGRGYRKLTRQN